MLKKHKNPKGGLTQAGRDFFKRKEGANLKPPVKKGVNPRRVSFAARFAGMKGPMKKPDGTPRKLMDVSKMKSIGWQYSTELNEGIEKTYDWYLENIGSFKEVKM